MEDLQYQLDLLTAMNEKLMNNEKIYRHIAEYSGNLYVYFDLKNPNSKVELIGKWDEFVGEKIVNHPFDEAHMLSFLREEDQDLFRRRLLDIEKRNLESDTIEVRTKSNKYYLSCEAKVSYDPNGIPYEKLINIRDITKLKANHDELIYLAYYDSITGLYNRNYFVSKLVDYIERAERTHNSVEVLLIDIDDFKKINDSLGLILGDELVQAFAQYLKDFEDDDTIIGRFGSDVFIFAIYNPCGNRTADYIYRNVRERLRHPFKLSDRSEVTFNVTCGVAEYPDAGDNALDIIKNTEIVLFTAKEQGKNTICYYEPSVLTNFIKNVSIENQMKEAISQNDFVLYFQPQYDATNGKLRGAEALLRWPDKNGGFNYKPAEFIPIAEKNGSINSIGNWVLHDAMKTIEEWKERFHIPIVLSVNISARQLEKDDFANDLIKMVQDYSIDPEMIEIELTESVFINDIDDVIDKINMIRAYGIKVSLDDFGTGYSSLSYLRKLPIDTLKIDKSFIDTAVNDLASGAIYEAVVNLAKKLGFETIAEGVETKGQLDYLRGIKCNTIQGFLLGKPMNKVDFEKLLIKQL